MKTRPNMVLNMPMAMKKKAKKPSQYPMKAKCFSNVVLMIDITYRCHIFLGAKLKPLKWAR